MSNMVPLNALRELLGAASFVPILAVTKKASMNIGKNRQNINICALDPFSLTEQSEWTWEKLGKI